MLNISYAFSENYGGEIALRSRRNGRAFKSKIRRINKGGKRYEEEKIIRTIRY